MKNTDKNHFGKSPAFQFYPKDFLSDFDVMSMTNEEVGCYIKLLCIDWLKSGIIDDTKKIQQMLNVNEQVFDSVREHVLIKFEKKGDKLFNPRLAEERIKQEKYRKQKAEAGKKSGKSRRNKSLQDEQVFNSVGISFERNANRTRTKTNPSSSSSSSSSNKETIKETLPRSSDPKG